MCERLPSKFLIAKTPYFSDYAIGNKTKRFYVRDISANLHDIDILFRINNEHLIHGYLLGNEPCLSKGEDEIVLKEEVLFKPQALPLSRSHIHSLKIILPNKKEVIIEEDVYPKIFIKLIDQITNSINCLAKANYYMTYIDQDCIGYVIYTNKLFRGNILTNVDAIDFYLTNFDYAFYTESKYPNNQVITDNLKHSIILSPTSYCPMLAKTVLEWFYGTRVDQDLVQFIDDIQNQKLRGVLLNLLSEKITKSSDKKSHCRVYGYVSTAEIEQLNMRVIQILLNSIYLVASTYFKQVELRVICLVVSWVFYLYFSGSAIYEEDITSVCKLARMWYSNEMSEYLNEKDFEVLIKLSSVLGQNDIYLRAPSSPDCIKVLNSEPAIFLEYYQGHFNYDVDGSTPVYANKNNYVTFYLDGIRMKVKLV